MAKLTGISAVLADRDRLAKWQANAGLRSKLPNKYLTADQRVMRRERIRKATPVFQGSDLTTGQAEAQARRDADLQYGRQRSMLNQENMDLQARQMRDAAWFNAYRDAVGKAQQTLAGLASTLNDGTLQSAVAPNDSSPEMSNASGVRSALASIAQGRVNSQGVADTGLLGALVASAGAQGQMNEGSIRAALKKLGVQRQGLEADYGAYRQKRFDQLKSDSRTRLLEDRAYNLNQYKAAADVADKASQVNQYGYLKSDWAKMTTGERQAVIRQFKSSRNSTSSDVAPATNAVKLRARSQIDSALALARGFALKGQDASTVRQAFLRGVPSQKVTDPKTGADSRTQAIPKIESLWADVAIDLAYRGGISPANVTRLRKLGISMKDLGYPTLASGNLLPVRKGPKNIGAFFG